MAAPHISLIIDPHHLTEYSAYDLLNEAARGRVGIDQRWLHALVDHPDKTLPDIVRFAGEPRADDRVELAGDLVSIFQYLRTPEGIPFLIELIREDPEDIADEVVEALVSIGRPAVDPLLKLYEEVGDENGAEIAFLLAGMEVKDPRILELLLKRLDVDWDDGLFHLEVYDDPTAIPFIEKRLETTTDEEQRLDLTDTIADLRDAESEPITPMADLDIWELYPVEADPDFEALPEEEALEFLDAPNPKLRAGAATRFFGEEYSLQARAKLLEKARTDPEPEVRANCWEAFFDLTEEEPELRRTMLARLKDPSTPAVERAGLALGLARHTDDKLVFDTIRALASDPETRERGVEAMWRSFDPRFGEDAVKFLEDPSLEVRRNAIWGVGYLKCTKQAHLLQKFFDDEDLRTDALHNYALSAPGPTTRKKMPQLFDNVSEMAKGFTGAEADAVKAAIDVRLVREGLKPLYQGQEDQEEAAPPEPARSEKIGRNEPCPCGSGKKYKKCCGQPV